MRARKMALLMAFLKWAHFPLNSQRLPRYESPKIHCFHALTFSIGKEAEIDSSRQPLATVERKVSPF